MQWELEEKYLQGKVEGKYLQWKGEKYLPAGEMENFQGDVEEKYLQGKVEGKYLHAGEVAQILQEEVEEKYLQGDVEEYLQGEVEEYLQGEVEGKYLQGKVDGKEALLEAKHDQDGGLTRSQVDQLSFPPSLQQHLHLYFPQNSSLLSDHSLSSQTFYPPLSPPLLPSSLAMHSPAFQSYFSLLLCPTSKEKIHMFIQI